MNMTLRLPDNLAAKLKEIAKENRRSLHAEILYQLEQAIKQEELTKELSWNGSDYPAPRIRN